MSVCLFNGNARGRVFVCFSRKTSKFIVLYLREKAVGRRLLETVKTHIMRFGKKLVVAVQTGIGAVMVIDAVLFACRRENFDDTFFTVVYIREMAIQAIWNCHTHFGKKIAASQNLLLLPQENGIYKNCLFVP